MLLAVRADERFNGWYDLRRMWFGCNDKDAMIKKGDNMSVGERQLLSLAQAIRSGVRIVVLDEASPSFDNHC